MFGRPRKDGERYPSGKLKPPTDPASVSAGARVALNRYQRAFEEAKSETNPRARVYGSEILRGVKEALSDGDAAIIDLVAGRNRSFQDLAERTGRKAHDLRIQFAQAAERLARHFEAVADQEE